MKFIREGEPGGNRFTEIMQPVSEVKVSRDLRKKFQFYQ